MAIISVCDLSDFHHRNPNQKDFSIGESRPGQKKIRNFENLKVELDKCDLLCKNCHGEIHYEMDKSSQEETFDYNIHRKDINLINNSIVNQRKTPEDIMKEINSGLYTYNNLNARELLHQKWLMLKQI